jgi:hypothetical protein
VLLTPDLTKPSKRHPKQLNPEFATIEWHCTEAILAHTVAHVFEIFDCCYAGNLSRGSSNTLRYVGTLSHRHGLRTDHPSAWEYLAATGRNGTAAIPGERSFTSALIWALEALLQKEGRFTTAELKARIIDAPHFRVDDQSPVLNSRNLDCMEQIVLAPVPTEEEFAKLEERNKNAKGSDSQELLDLRFVFKEHPPVDMIEKFATALSGIIRHHAIGVTRVIWGDLLQFPAMTPSSRAKEQWLKASHQLTLAAQRRRLERSSQDKVEESTHQQRSPSSPGDSSLDRSKKRPRLELFAHEN